MYAAAVVLPGIRTIPMGPESADSTCSKIEYPVLGRDITVLILVFML